MAAAARACAVSLLASQHNIAIVLVSMSARGVGVKGHMIMISFQTFNSINVAFLTYLLAQQKLLASFID